MNCLLVADQGLLREGLAMLLRLASPQVHLRQADCPAQARELLQAYPGIEIVLLDQSQPAEDGLPALQALRRAAPQARLIVLSPDDRCETVQAALASGAAGVVPRSACSRTLAAALAEVSGGGIFEPRSGRPAPASEPATSVIHDLAGLTPRQTQVLQLLLEGKSNKAIGRLLDLSPSTVRTHVESLFLRLRVHTRAQAAAAAVRLGLSL
jgi:DNA-binding NarL/FixJ family response regulator